MKQHRIDSTQSIDQAEIQNLIAEGNHVIVQFAHLSYTVDLLEELNLLARELDPDLTIRFYGHFGGEFDASVLRYIPDAPSVYIDCLTSAENLASIAELVNLREFGFGVYEGDHRDLLACESLHRVESLTLGEIRKSNVELSHLAKFQNLTRFHTTGQARNLEVVTKLPRLASLSLSQIKKDNSLSFISALHHLAELRIMLGGRESLEEIQAPRLQKLEVVRVRGLETLGHLGRFEALEDLLLEDQGQITSLQFGPNPRLRKAIIANCKTLTDLVGIGTLPTLEELRIARTALDYDALIASPMPASLRILAFYTRSVATDRRIRQDLDSRGYREF